MFLFLIKALTHLDYSGNMNYFGVESIHIDLEQDTQLLRFNYSSLKWWYSLHIVPVNDSKVDGTI